MEAIDIFLQPKKKKCKEMLAIAQYRSMQALLSKVHMLDNI
jgi:hypothetical protein